MDIILCYSATRGLRCKFTSDLNIIYFRFQLAFACFHIYVNSQLSDIWGLFQGDGNIRYYEVTTEKPYLQYLMEFRSPAPQKGLCNVTFCYLVLFYYSKYNSCYITFVQAGLVMFYHILCHKCPLLSVRYNA